MQSPSQCVGSFVAAKIKINNKKKFFKNYFIL
jgi:hypothetical protein